MVDSNDDLNAETQSLTSEPAQHPDHIGPYRILEPLGEGGMGTVYLAEQTEPVRRRVALKLIKLGMDSKQVIARFEAERQALAMMNHSNVARVLDAGLSDDSRPFFVMELVKGEPITRHCDKQRLTIDQRLALFMQVCSAVQHAHQKGIIHRDIKPSNILVEYADGKSVPKVIDFGVAKATNQRLTEKTLFTEQGQLIGTPEYMSPEQAEMTSQDIDTRSDIYSLGVLLYELLTGTLPFDPSSLRSSGFAAIQRIIREVEPPKPSTRLSRLDDDEVSSSTIAERRRCEPSRLNRLLRGDLDWIVMKCLEKDRTRRYDTAGALAMEIERHLNDKPVLAGPPSAAYRVRKLIRRHRGAAVGLAAFVLLLLTASIVTTTLWRIADKARKTEKIARVDAEAAREEADRARETEKTARVDAEAAREEADWARETEETAKDDAEAGRIGAERFVNLLSRGVVRADARAIADELRDTEQDFPKRPVPRAAMFHLLGEALHNLGFDGEAAEEYGTAIDLLKSALGEAHPATLNAMRDLGVALRQAGELDRAEAVLREVVEIARRALGNEHRDTLRFVSILASVYVDQRRYDEAEPMLVKTLEVTRRLWGEEHRRTLHSMNELAQLYAEQGRFDEAEPLYVKALEIGKRVLCEEDTLRFMQSLAILYHRQGRYDEAEPLYVKSLEIMKRVTGEEHPATLGFMRYLAILYAHQRRMDDARQLVRALLEAERRRAERPGASANDKLDLARDLLTCQPADLRDPETALLLARDACAMTDNAKPVYLDTLARAQHLTGDTPAAIETQKKALSLLAPNAPRDSYEASLAKFEAALKEADTAVEPGGG